jgi:hypothetical protein
LRPVTMLDGQSRKMPFKMFYFLPEFVECVSLEDSKTIIVPRDGDVPESVLAKFGDGNIALKSEFINSRHFWCAAGHFSGRWFVSDVAWEHMLENNFLGIDALKCRTV